MSYSVTTDMFNYSFNPSLSEKLKLFRDAGFEYLHWCDNWNDDVVYSHDDIQNYADNVSDLGLHCLDVHGTATQTISIDSPDSQAHKTYIKLLENRVNFCHNIGGDAVVVHPPAYYVPEYEKRLARSHFVLRKLENMCMDRGVKLAIENCYKDNHIILQDYFTTYSPEYIGFCYDSGHANLYGNYNEVTEFSKRLIVTHLHDNKGEKDDHQHLGWGNIDWKTVTNWLKMTPLKKPWNLEVTHSYTHFKGSMTEYLNLVRQTAEIHLKV